MTITVLTLFPNVIKEYISTSIIKKAIEKELVNINIVDLREFGIGDRRNVDDTVYGGGDGMVIRVDILDKAISHIKETTNKDLDIIYLSPKGKVLTQETSIKIANENKDMLLIAGHYEGIDERIFKLHKIQELSIGDYVLTGGELPALVLIDTVVRLIPGVIKEGSSKNESHTDYLLEEPQYTKPQEYKNITVPEILLSGNHEKIAEYRLNEKLNETNSKRPDLLNKYMTLKSHTDIKN